MHYMQFSSLLYLICTFFLPKLVNGAGSITYLTDNGFPINFLQSIVDSPMVQKKLKSRWKWETWDVVPGTHAYQIYVFNITNPQEVESGGKPNLQEVGPYYYNERRYKFDVSINLDLTVNYERNYTYTFDADKSNGTENDLVNILNLPLIIFSSIGADIDASATNAAVKALTSSGESLVKQRVKVGDILYHGIDVSNYKPYLKLFGSDKNNYLTEEFVSGKYGILKVKAGTHEKPYMVDSGLLDQKNVGKILEWNSLNRLNWWSGDHCNMINGSDSSVFPPYLDTHTQLKLFDLDLCRSVDMDYFEDMTFKGVITGLRFKMTKNTLEDPKVFQPNMCFCRNPENCLKKGVIDVSKCRFGAPIVLSFAHFLDASPEYLQSVSGLNPNPILHQTQVDVEPVTGAVINFQKRYQWNIWLKPLRQIDFFKNIKSIIFPVIWNDDVFHLNPDKAQLLVEELANQMGGTGDLASDLVNRLGTSSQTSGVSSLSRTNLHLFHILLAGIMFIICSSDSIQI